MIKSPGNSGLFCFSAKVIAMKIFIHATLLLFLTSCASFNAGKKDPCLENRSALDIGSGATKFKIFAVDICEKKIIKVVFEEEKSILFKEDLEKSGDQKFSMQVQSELKTFLEKVKNQNKNFQVTLTLGVATEAFRASLNGKELIEEVSALFHWPLKVISQEEEARLGFLSASSKFPEIRNTRSMVWDIGGGSMQMVVNLDEGMNYYFGKIASVSFKNLVIEKIKKQKELTTPNPLSRKEVESALKLTHKEAQKELTAIKKMIPSDLIVVGVGGVFQYSLLKQMGLKDQFSNLNLASALSSRTGFSDADFKSEYASTELTNLILVKGFMDYLGIKNIQVGKVNLTEGVVMESLL